MSVVRGESAEALSMAPHVSMIEKYVSTLPMFCLSWSFRRVERGTFGRQDLLANFGDVGAKFIWERLLLGATAQYSLGSRVYLCSLDLEL